MPYYATRVLYLKTVENVQRDMINDMNAVSVHNF